MIEMIVRVVPAGIVSDPLSVGVHMRSFGMSRLVGCECTFLRGVVFLGRSGVFLGRSGVRLSFCGRRAFLGNVSAAYAMALAGAAV